MSPRAHTQDPCRELLVKLSNFVDGELTGPERRAVVAHLKRCPCCQAMADGLQHTVETCRKAGTARLMLRRSAFSIAQAPAWVNLIIDGASAT